MDITANEIEATKLLFEAAKTFIPVVTAYLVLFAGSLGYFWRDERGALNGSAKLLAKLTVLLGVLSLGFWSGVVPCCIRTLEFQNIHYFDWGQICAQVAHSLFFISVLTGLLFFWSIFYRFQDKQGAERG